MNETWQQKWNTMREKRSDYPNFRKMLLWTRDIGLVLLFVLCLGIALFASPTVLSDHPWLQSYVNFMGRYFGAIQRLSIGAIYPQVSQLVFAVGWGVGIFPFASWLLEYALYQLILNYQETRTDSNKRYVTNLKERMGGMATFIDIIATPVVIGILAWAILGDLGVFHSVGEINGKMVAKANLSNPQLIISMIFIHLYTSRAGLGLLGPFQIYLGMFTYVFALLSIFIALPPWAKRMYQRLTLQRVEW